MGHCPEVTKELQFWSCYSGQSEWRLAVRSLHRLLQAGGYPYIALFQKLS